MDATAKKGNYQTVSQEFFYFSLFIKQLLMDLFKVF